MIEFLETATNHISGLYTLPWILVGFVATMFFSHIYGDEKVDRVMRKIGLILLYVFVPLLLFRIFLSFDLHESEIAFAILCFVVLSLMYVLAYLFARVKINKLKIKQNERNDFIKTILTNQGRSSAFVGGAMLAIPEWRVMAAIYMSTGAIFLFAIIPYILSHLHKKDHKKSIKITTLPWYLKIFPWYLLIFAFAGIILHGAKGLTVNSLGTDFGIFFTFFTQLTIPAALYYVGAGIHPHDLKINELKKMFSSKKDKIKDHWSWTRNVFFLTVIITPILTVIFFVIFLSIGLIPNPWFAVITINSIMPITSTNMFLIPYGINKKVTALSVTWTTIICVPMVVILITFFNTYL